MVALYLLQKNGTETRKFIAAIATYGDVVAVVDKARKQTGRLEIEQRTAAKTGRIPF